MYLGIDKFYHLKVVEMNPLLLPVCLKIWLVLRATVEAYPGGHYRRGRGMLQKYKTQDRRLI